MIPNLMSMKTPVNRQVKLLQKLIRPSQRKKSGMFIAEGQRVVEQILISKKLHCEFVLVSEKLWDEWNHKIADVEVLAGEPELLEQISSTVQSQHIFAICHEPDQYDFQEIMQQTGLIVASDALQDPGNIGTIYRSAVWFGATGWLHGKGSVDLFQPKVVRSTAGATGLLPFVSGPLPAQLETLAEKGWNINILHLSDDAISLPEWRPSEREIIVIANEGSGPDETLVRNYPSLMIPSYSSKQVESLNASVSAGIVMHAWAASR